MFFLVLNVLDLGYVESLESSLGLSELLHVLRSLLGVLASPDLDFVPPDGSLRQFLSPSHDLLLSVECESLLSLVPPDLLLDVDSLRSLGVLELSAQVVDSPSAVVHSLLVVVVLSSQVLLSVVDALVVPVAQSSHVLALALVLADLVSVVVHSCVGPLSLVVQVLSLRHSPGVVSGGRLVAVSPHRHSLLVVRHSLLVELGVSHLGAGLGLSGRLLHVLLGVPDLACADSLLESVLGDLLLVDVALSPVLGVLELGLVVRDALVAPVDGVAVPVDRLLVVGGLALVDLHQDLLVSLESLLELVLSALVLAVADLSPQSPDVSVCDSLLGSPGLVQPVHAGLSVSLVRDELLLDADSCCSLGVSSLLSEGSDLLSDELAGVLVVLSLGSEELESSLPVASEPLFDLLDGLALELESSSSSLQNLDLIVDSQSLVVVYSCEYSVSCDLAFCLVELGFQTLDFSIASGNSLLVDLDLLGVIPNERVL